MNKHVTNDWVTRWLLLLQEFDIKILDKPAKYNLVADFISRLTINSDYMPIEDSFPDEYLFSISTHSSWYADIANDLVVGRFAQYITSKKNRNIV